MMRHTSLPLSAIAFISVVMGVATADEPSEQQAISALEELGFEVVAVPVRANSLLASLDRNDDNDVVGIHLLGSRRDMVTDKHLKAVAALPALERLVVNRANFSAEGLSYLENHKTLNTIELERTSVPAEALIGKLPKFTTS